MKEQNLNDTLILKTEEDFDKKYKYDETVKSDYFDDGDGKLETFGKDVELAIKLNNEKRCWTMIETDDVMYLMAGYHLVNRIYYVITTKPYESEDEAYLIEEY